MDKKFIAKNLRYKHSRVDELCLDTIFEFVNSSSEICDEITYSYEDENILLSAFDDDEDALFEFKMTFSEVSVELQKLSECLSDDFITEHFDDIAVCLIRKGECGYNIVGFDSYEEDYYSLTRYEECRAEDECIKRIMRMNKSDLINSIAQVMGVITAYLTLKQKYDYLEATLNILRDENNSILQVIKNIEEAYEEANREDFLLLSEKTRRFDELISQLPDRLFIE